MDMFTIVYGWVGAIKYLHQMLNGKMEKNVDRGLQRVASSRLISSSKSETQNQLRGSLSSRCAWFFFT